MKDIFIHVPIRMVQPPKCCVCSFDWWILWYASFQHVSQPLLLHNSTNDETQSFILIWIQITSKTNDMKMQIMKLMIWKDVFKYIHHCQFKFHRLSLANGTLNHWAATFSCHNLSGAMPVLDTWKFAGNGAVLKRQFFQCGWKGMEMMLGNIIRLHHDFFELMLETTPLKIQNAQSLCG